MSVKDNTKIEYQTVVELIDEVEQTVINENMVGASREQVARGTLLRLRRRLKEIN